MSSPASYRTVIALASIVIVALGLQLAGGVILPVLTALFVASVSSPVVRALQRARVPRVLATILTLLLDALVLAGVVALALTSISELYGALPRYGTALETLHADTVRRLAHTGLISAGSMDLDRVVDVDSIRGVVGAVFSEVTEIVSNVLLVVLLVGFILFEGPAFEHKLEMVLGSHEGLDRVAESARRMQRYLAVKTAISVLAAGLAGVCLAVVGVDFPLLWVLLTFLLNFVPTVGPAIAVVPSTLVALLTLGPGPAAAALVSQLIVHLVVGSIIEPRVMGEALGISTLVVMISMMAWGWLWGPVGALFAVPLTRIVVTLLEQSRETRWLAMLLASNAGAEEQGRAWGWSAGTPPAGGATEGLPAPAAATSVEPVASPKLPAE